MKKHLRLYLTLDKNVPRWLLAAFLIGAVSFGIYASSVVIVGGRVTAIEGSRFTRGDGDSMMAALDSLRTEIAENRRLIRENRIALEQLSRRGR